MAIKLPQKPRSGFHSINELTRAVNGLIDYISSFAITGEKPIRINRTMFQTTIGIDLNENGNPEIIGYSGFFKVVIESGGNTCAVIDGSDEEKEFAGCAYYNAKKVWCNKASGISIQEGFLCLSISNHSTYGVTYGFESDIPDMPTLSDDGYDNTVKYPLAYFYSDKEGKWAVQQLCFGLPQLWCFGSCDTEIEAGT